jgi:hypothetical protein
MRAAMVTAEIMNITRQNFATRCPATKRAEAVAPAGFGEPKR